MTFDWYKYCSTNYPKYMSLVQLKVYVARNKITTEQFKTISGEDYVA